MELNTFNLILSQYGYQYNYKRNSIIQTKPLKNTDFYKKNSYKIIVATLRKLKQPFSNVFLTAICDAVKNDKVLRAFIKKQMSDNIGFLTYNNNSCYKDCVLMALFARKNPLIKNCFFREIKTDLQEKLYEIYTDIQNGETTSCYEKLDKVLRKYKNYDFGKARMNDASEFLYFLFSEMKFEPVKKHVVSHLTNFTTRKKLYEKNMLWGPIDTIKSNRISKGIINLEKMIEKRELLKLETSKEGYEHTIIIEKIIFAPYLVFHIDRKFITEDYNEEVDYSPIIFSEEIYTDRSLSLHAIILFENKHYTALIKDDNDVWYFYDDMEEKIQQIGSYTLMLNKYKDFAEKNGILFFYS